MIRFLRIKLFSDYYKKLLLPSNGLDYNSIISIRPLESSFIFVLNDIFYNSSQSELITSVIEPHIKFEKNIEELYFSDAFFLWVLLFYSATNSDKIEYVLQCSNCLKENKISIDIQNLDVIYSKDNLNKIAFYSFKDYEIVYEYRKLKHNIYTSNLNANFDDKLNLIRNFLFQQILEIKKNSKSFSRNNLDELIKYEGVSFLSDFLSVLKKEPFGIQNNLNFKCHNCSSVNELTIIDSLNYSMTLLNDNHSIELTEKAIDSILSLTDSKLLTTSEALKIPYSNLFIIQNKIAQIIKKKTGEKSYFDNVDSL